MTFEFSEKANQIKEGIFAVLNTADCQGSCQ